MTFSADDPSRSEKSGISDPAELQPAKGDTSGRKTSRSVPADAAPSRAEETRQKPVPEHSGGAASSDAEPEIPPAAPSEPVLATAKEHALIVENVIVDNSSPQKGDLEIQQGPAPSPLSITLNESAELSATKRITPAPILPQTELFKVGDTLGHFEITGFLGQGGMGRVYEAKDTALDRRVAVKVLNYQRAQDQATVARFLNEARSAARLNHEHIAQVYFCGEERGLPYIAFEFVDGENLRDYVEKHGPVSLENAVVFVLQTADALAHAANNGVTHRDIKPSNIIITPQLKAKLIDMGLARTLHPDDPEDELTLSGTALGTYDYMSPEQAFDARAADVRSDLYSLGCTFFFMLTGRPPYLDGKGLQKLLLHQGKEAPDVREFAPDVPESVSVIIQKLMKKDPADRYQKPEELIADLRVVAEQIGVFQQEAGAIAVPVPDSPIEEGKFQWFTYHLPWVCAFLLIGLLGTVLWFIGEKEDRLFTEIAEQDFKAIPSRLSALTPPISPEPNSVSAGTLLPYSLNARRKSVDFRVSERGRSDETAVALEMPIRQFGGIGVAAVSSNDILNRADTGNLSPEGAKLLEVTSDSQSDLWSGGWSSVIKEDEKTEKDYNDGSVSFREGVDPVVDRKGKKDGYYETLDEAIASFNTWNQSLPPKQRREVVIRLAFDGDMTVSPLCLTDADVRLVPAPGYVPRIVFRPDQLPEGGTASLWTLTNSRLTLSDLSLFFDSTDQKMISEFWTLILFDSRSTVRLENTRIAIRNGDQDGKPFHPDVAFFRLAETGFRRDAKPMMPLADGDDENETDSSAPPDVKSQKENLVLKGGVFQGEAALAVLTSPAPFRLEAERAVMILDGPVLDSDEKAVLSAAEKRRVYVSMKEVFCWSRSPLLRISRRQAALRHPRFHGSSGREIAAEFNRCFLVLNEQPIGEAAATVPSEEQEFQPNWKMTENLLANVSGLFHFAEDSAGEPSPADQEGQTGKAETDSAPSFSNDNIRFHLDLPNRPLWNISPEEAEIDIFNQARKNLESEIGRSWLESLVLALASRE